MSSITGARNKQNTSIRLPNGYDLVAIAYGDPSRDDHLAIVLGINPDHNQWATWNANFSVKTHDGAVACGNGNYFNRISFEARAAKFPEQGDALTIASIEAWNDFHERAKFLVRWR